MAVELKDADKEVLRLCHDYVYVDLHYLYDAIYDQVGRSHSSARRRLKQLVDEEYLTAFYRVDTLYYERDTIYSLGKLGARWFYQEHAYVDFDARWARELRIWYKHALGILRSSEGLRLQLERSHSFQFLDFVPEVRGFYQYGDQKNDVVRPDALLLVGARNSPTDTMCFLTEYEHSWSKYRVVEEKLERYDGLLKSDVKTEQYKDHVAFEAIAKRLVPLFIVSTNVSVSSLVDKIKRYKDHHTETKLFQEPVLVTSEQELVADCYGKIFVNVSSKHQDRVALFTE